MPSSGNKADADVTNRTVDRRQFLLGCTTFAAAAGMGGVTPVNAARAQQPPTAQLRPNILFMLGDNIGYGVLSSYNGGIAETPTPRIDSIGADGLRLTNFNVENQCTPSRAAILTGRLPIRSGIGKAIAAGAPGGLHPWEITLAEMLGDAGYRTAMFGRVKF
jgi:arylsulfatase A-like enzyme